MPKPHKFFNQINFSASNEDGAAELSGLNIQPTDRVLCVTGSGARTLDILIGNPAEIVSIDLNETQNHLLKLKIAAYGLDDYHQFSQLIGLTPCDDRMSLFERIQNRLDKETCDYWRRHAKSVRHRILYCGTWEQSQRWMARAGIFRRRRIAELWNAADLETQRQLWQRHWSGSFMRVFLAMISNRFLWTHVIREPGAKLIPPDVNVAENIKQCLDRMVDHSLLRTNPWANLLFFGRYLEGCTLPPHLQEHNFERVRDRLHRIKIVTNSVVSYLQETELPFDAFSLSDFSSYADANAYQATWQAVVQRAAPNAKFCERFFLVPRNSIESKLDFDIAASWQRRLDEIPELSRQIFKQDHTGLYAFRCGSISAE